MHFVGMLAFHLDILVTYDIGITVLSASASIIASFIAFKLTGDTQVNKVRIGIGGFFMGSGIVTMHYTGMAAMRSEAAYSYDPLRWLLSAVIAMAASYAALYLFRIFRQEPKFSKRKLLCSIVMALAICGMHYTGMSATLFQIVGSRGTHHLVHDSEPQLFLLLGVSISTFLILGISWAAMLFDRMLLEKMAFSDPLTGLQNRHSLMNYFENQFTFGNGTVLFIDLDRFKTINDTLGHDIGDLLLCEVANRIQSCLGDNDTVFRLGGDEFLVASLHSGEERTSAIAASMMQTVKQPYFIEGNELYVTASIGISLSPQHGNDRASLLKAADTAMYYAKNNGKNRFRVFDNEMDRQLMRKMELEKDLRKALVHEEFKVEYQPKWDSVSNQMVGMEALLRWQHPVLGVISPGEFIPISEDTGLIVPITRWMLMEVCSQNKQWQVDHKLFQRVSVNMSVRVFESQTLVQMVGDALNAADMHPDYLELEITESIAIYDKEDTISQLHELRQIGVLVSLDDFGTGYSSLGSLDELPVDILKIDQIFIRKSNNPSKQAIISTIIAIAQNLNLQVVAEGVETTEEVAFLQSRGCRLMQGYYYGVPMKPEEIVPWLNSRTAKYASS
jgi:diguanylate cyclase (GGDEF)-like protein